jgi:predicted MFS family arabinose efflux permease
MNQEKEILWNRSFALAWIANFLMGFSFYMLIPTLPFYLSHQFNAGRTMIGVILSAYIIAALLIRPFSGYMVDSFSRKLVYLLSYFLFVGAYLGYIVAASIFFILILRFFHGLTWGVCATAGNTLAIDIMPHNRRGEGLGYFGLSNNLAMAIGPMVGLFLFDNNNLNWVFYTALLTGVVGLMFAMSINVPSKPAMNKEPISLDRFILLKGIPVGLNLILIAVSYGMILSFAAMYGKEMGVKGTGVFFTLMSFGIAASRIFAGKQVDKGKIHAVASMGILTLVISFGFFSLWSIEPVYLITAFFIGIGFGIIFPSFQTIFISLAPHSKRGTANATYLTSFDVGVGIGMLLSGRIAESYSLSAAFMTGTLFMMVALLVYVRFTSNFYQRNKLEG